MNKYRVIVQKLEKEGNKGERAVEFRSVTFKTRKGTNSVYVDVLEGLGVE